MCAKFRIDISEIKGLFPVFTTDGQMDYYKIRGKLSMHCSAYNKSTEREKKVPEKLLLIYK